MDSDGAGKILAVDDVPENVRLLEAVLVPRGYEVVAATSGEEALDVVASARPDLILLDVVMPGNTSCSPASSRCSGSSATTTRSRS